LTTVRGLRRITYQVSCGRSISCPRISNVLRPPGWKGTFSVGAWTLNFLRRSISTLFKGVTFSHWKQKSRHGNYLTPSSNPRILQEPVKNASSRPTLEKVHLPGGSTWARENWGAVRRPVMPPPKLDDFLGLPATVVIFDLSLEVELQILFSVHGRWLLLLPFEKTVIQVSGPALFFEMALPKGSVFLVFPATLIQDRSLDSLGGGSQGSDISAQTILLLFPIRPIGSLFLKLWSPV